jgi:hypothetical protein
MLLARFDPDLELVADGFVAHGLVALDHPSIDELVAASGLAAEVHNHARVGAIGEVNEGGTHSRRIAGVMRLQAAVVEAHGRRIGDGGRELEIAKQRRTEASEANENPGGQQEADEEHGGEPETVRGAAPPSSSAAEVVRHESSDHNGFGVDAPGGGVMTSGSA